MADDMTAAEAQAVRGAVADLLRRQRRTQFVSKYTDYPRISYLTKAFPDARFVHITRDGRGVAHSYAKKMRSGSFGTWDERDLWIQALDEDSQERWAKIDQSPLALGLLLWKYFIGEIRDDAANVAPEQYLEVRYADLVSRPRELLSDVFGFCGMDWTPRFTRELDHLELTDMNRKWRTELSEDERVLLDELVVEPELRELFDPS